MKLINVFTKLTAVSLFTAASFFNTTVAEESQEAAVAFPDKYMLRLGAYIIDGTTTQFSVSSDVGGLGTVIDYQRDLGGEDGDTIPRNYFYYRFNERHRNDFTSFSIYRKGTRKLDINPPIIIDGEDFSGGTLNSDIKYTLYKVGYSYSFYHSPKMEVSITAGLNFTNYDLEFSNDTGGKAETAGLTSPLPIFGLRMGYAITHKWSVNYVDET